MCVCARVRVCVYIVCVATHHAGVALCVADVSDVHDKVDVINLIVDKLGCGQ